MLFCVQKKRVTADMRNAMFCLLISSTWLSYDLQAQRFEAGYVLTLRNDTLQGFIEAREEGATSRVIHFKRSLADSYQTDFEPLDINGFYLKELGEVYVGKVVDIDMKSIDINSLDPVPTVKFVRDAVFLRLVVAGKLNLYFTADLTGKNHYFLQEGNGDIKELVRIRYAPVPGRMAEVDSYRDQLAQYLNACHLKFTNLGFTEGELKKAVSRYNECSGSKSTFIQADRNMKYIFYGAVGVALSSASYTGVDNHPQNLNVSDIKFRSKGDPSVMIGVDFSGTKTTQRVAGGVEIFWKEHAFSGAANNGYEQRSASYSFYTAGLNAFGKYSFKTNVRPYLKVGVSAFYVEELKNTMSYSSDIPYSGWQGKITTFGNFGYGYFGSVGVPFKQTFAEFRVNSMNNSAPAAGGKFSVISMNLLVGYRFGK
jgi:hypothetical protein